jgi:Cytochrome c7 and related cytochrome c
VTPFKGWITFRLGAVAVALAGLAACSTGKNTQLQYAPYVTSGQFTAAQPSVLLAAEDYFNVYHSHVQQPIAFSHRIHLKNGMQCVDCHQGAAQGPDAGIPSVKLCWTCHQVIATDKPEVRKVAAYYKKGQDIPWQRVYWFYPAAHVKFWHAPHIQAGIGCQTCHGDMTKQTVAVRSPVLTMGYCLNCHKLHKASTDCTTCHF